MKVFSEKDNSQTTFEVCIFNLNQSHCNNLFSQGRRSLSVEQYMLKNKAETAFKLLENGADKLTIPTYISDAIKWIRE